MKKTCFYCLGKMKKGICPGCGSTKNKTTPLSLISDLSSTPGIKIYRNKITGRYVVRLSDKKIRKGIYMKQYLHAGGSGPWSYSEEFYTLWGARRTAKKYQKRRKEISAWNSAQMVAAI